MERRNGIHYSKGRKRDTLLSMSSSNYRVRKWQKREIIIFLLQWSDKLTHDTKQFSHRENIFDGIPLLRFAFRRNSGSIFSHGLHPRKNIQTCFPLKANLE